MVVLSVPFVYVTFIDEVKPEPLVKDNSKAVGAVTVIFPLAGDRLAPDKEYVFSGDVVPTTTPLKYIAGLTKRTGLLVGVTLTSLLYPLSNPAIFTALILK
jgi:hypothetical protein